MNEVVQGSYTLTRHWRRYARQSQSWYLSLCVWWGSTIICSPRYRRFADEPVTCLPVVRVHPRAYSCRTRSMELRGSGQARVCYGSDRRSAGASVTRIKDPIWSVTGDDKFGFLTSYHVKSFRTTFWSKSRVIGYQELSLLAAVSENWRQSYKLCRVYNNKIF